jgi:4-amino-4-deoxy-L-arabinose transferase-like glycosyltransferase
VLYSEIWSDQPPLFTHVLRLWLDALGWDVDHGRMLVLLFAMATVFALYDSVRLIAGHAAAVLSVLLLAGSAYFPRLSVSIMLGLPSLSLATLALWSLVRWHASARRGWLTAAGVLMASSLACKLATAVLLPAFALWIATSGPRVRDGLAWRPAAVWLFVTLITTAVWLVMLVGPAQLSALVDTHLAARQSPGLSRFGPWGLAATSFAEWPLVVLGFGGCVAILRWRLRAASVFVLWVVFAATALLAHAPIWYHHQLLLSVPLSAAGGIAVAELFRPSQVARLPAPLLTGARIAAVALIVALPLWSSNAVMPATTAMQGTPEQVLAAIRAHAAATPVMITSNPMYAFRAGVEVPPALSALPLKRVGTDPRLPDDVRAAFAALRPNQVLLAPGAPTDVAAWFHSAMGDGYRIAFAEAGAELYLRTEPSSERANADR